MNPTQKALVIGASGQDGSLLCLSLLKKNYTVIGTSRNSGASLKNHLTLGIEKDLQVKSCDISDLLNLRKLISEEYPDEIYNLAAQSSVGRSFTDPSGTIESIATGTLNLLETCKELKYRGNVFFAGSSEIFGNTIKPANLDHFQNPMNPYAIAKQASFNLVKLYRKLYGIKCNTGILFNHESPLRGSQFVTQKIISGAIKCSKNKNHKLELGNISISRDWGWAEEYVEAIQILNKSNKDHIICTGQLTKLIDFISITFAKFNLNYNDHVVINEKDIRQTDIKQSFGNPEPFYNEFEWKAKLNIDEIIQRLIESKLLIDFDGFD